MNNENLIHVKFEYDEAIQGKKDILSSEIGLLQIAKAIKNHRTLRAEEFNAKLKLYKKIKELKLNLGKLQQILPKIKVPEILIEKKSFNQMEKISKEKQSYNDDLESQLQEIKNRLKELG